ncbi:hypothetical protein F4X86_04635 [Candidatus Saccharibacteria bacterium]|nr:hypothetical protein [Candidatus Saccharibacteria bacterium]
MHAINPPYESFASPRSRPEAGYRPPGLNRPEVVDTMERTNNLVIPGSKYSRYEQLKQPVEDPDEAARKGLKAMLLGAVATTALIWISVSPEEAERQPEPAAAVENGYYYDQEDGYYYLMDRE